MLRFYNIIELLISCSEAYVQVNGGERICGLRSTQKIWSKCGTEFKISYYVSPRVYKGFKFFYECKEMSFIYFYAVISVNNRLYFTRNLSNRCFEPSGM